MALAAQWRHSVDEVRVEDVRRAIDLVKMGGPAADRLESLRLLMQSLGDFCLKDPPAEVYTAYSLQGSIKGYEKDLEKVLPDIRRECLSGDDPRLDDESARFLAMVEDDDDALAALVAAMWTEKSSATSDMHYLVVYSRLRDATPRTAGRLPSTPYSASTANWKARPSATNKTGTPASSRS